MKKFLKVAMIPVLMALPLLPTPAHALFGLDEATRAEQFAQIALAEKELEHILQMLEKVEIGREIGKIFEQLSGLTAIVEAVMEFDPPEELTKDYEFMTPPQFLELNEQRMTFLEEVNAEIAALEKEIALDDGQMEVLSMALNIASNPPSDITVGQAGVIGDASRLEQQRRESALELLRAKRVTLEKQLEIGERKANKALGQCIRLSKCG